MSRGEAAHRRSRAEGARRASESARGLWASESETFIYLFILPFVSGRVALVCGRGRQLRCPSDSLALRALPLAQGPVFPSSVPWRVGLVASGPSVATALPSSGQKQRRPLPSLSLR